MKIINNPFTKTGDIRYFELLKIFSFLMVFIMAFSLLSNEIVIKSEIIQFLIPSIIIILVYALGLTLAILEILEFIHIMRYMVLPFIAFTLINRFNLLKNEVIQLSKKLKEEFTYSSFNNNKLCVMRC